MRRAIYANYAATTPSLTPAVTEALVSYLGEGLHFSAGRNFEGLEDGAIALRARRALGRLFGVSTPLRVILMSGATEALNMALRGLLRPGDHALASGVEHNAVARPLHAMSREGIIALDWLPCAPDGSLDPSVIRKFVKRETRLIALSHASNVLGTILPV